MSALNLLLFMQCVLEVRCHGVDACCGCRVLMDNNLTSLPPSVERLTDLTELTLTNLQLHSLPFVMGAMTNLRKLRLTVSRYMQNPPFEIVTQGTAVLLTYMRKCYMCVRTSGYMNISGMGLETLPHEVPALGNLRHLQARDNLIMHISRSLDQMNCIEKLHLHRNGLNTLENGLRNHQRHVK